MQKILFEKMETITFDGQPAIVVKESDERTDAGLAIAEMATRRGELLAGESFRVHEHNHNLDADGRNEPCKILGTQR